MVEGLTVSMSRLIVEACPFCDPLSGLRLGFLDSATGNLLFPFLGLFLLSYSCEANGSKFAGVEGRKEFAFPAKAARNERAKRYQSIRAPAIEAKSRIKGEPGFNRCRTTTPNRASRMVIALE